MSADDMDMPVDDGAVDAIVVRTGREAGMRAVGDRNVRWMIGLEGGRWRFRHLHPPRFAGQVVGWTSGGEAVVRVAWDGPVPGRAEIDRWMAEVDRHLRAAAKALIAEAAAGRDEG